ncbi:hypothetical protein [Nocardia sp. 852002-51244_SCH5132740]|uniref:hypothetical protein n=1 Tax=Nocardia sp. 852002-51244_SCH5132740 TaxID=1834099 RepID=UPI0007E9266D|nr:hypothetical protein [Nocardia sp. 852002-51244_SCH5132740]OBB53099.1 hypothetical protein A5748_14845 [Nocardia sp. 852002-51244_SCH5132740]
MARRDPQQVGLVIFAAPGVGPVALIFGAGVGFALVVMVLCALAFPAPHHRYYDHPCDPFCSATSTSTSVPEGAQPWTAR